MQEQPIVKCNTVRSVWEKPLTENLLCEHLEVFSETWPTSGTMRNGQVFELPMQELHTIDTESSSSPILRTPAASEAERGHQPEDKARARGGQVTLSGQVSLSNYFLPTPNTMDHLPARNKEDIDFSKGGHRNVRETVLNETNWGKFEPAIKRWEAVLGRPAPEPTKPDGK